MKKGFRFILNHIPRPILIKLSYLAKPVLAVSLRGEKYTDPIDGKSFSTFLPYGYVHQRPNVLSPSTLSLERHRLLWLYLERKTDFFTKPRKMLHFAPEQAFYKRFKKMNHLEYTTTDLNSPLADVKADICDLPFKDNSYDIIFCNHVLEHIPNDDLAMEELYRVLKSGGFAILQIPQDLKRETTFEDDSITDPKKRAEIFGQYDHVRIYGRDYFSKLKEKGFEVEQIALANELTLEEIDRYRIDPKEILPVCHKPI
ncbi:methyltransferase domain-containing protein [Mesonia sp. MT50]|uniref:Methyltransferase domain-containing protein n=1 Tax=Mesonia profundi TaxID=3070998 RepID=A0ABU1A2L2_9FLAO|nr:methyltransferase domain-containing protein [Mesonia profundi]MDQ7917496.1 methyltransferase domain-containing protein [Mesonia profundi]